MAKKFTPTPAQADAIAARDRTLLVSAAAGSGKTATLTERIIQSLTDEAHHTSLSRLLVVTFTKASAADMREKIGKALSEALEDDPKNTRLAQEQLLLPSARISTIHSLCAHLLRRYADEMGLAPGFRVAEAAENTLLAIRVMEELIEDIMSGAAEGITPEEFASLSDTLTGAKTEDSLADVLRSLYENKLLSEIDGVEALRKSRDRLRAEIGKPLLETAFGEEICERYAAILEDLHTRLVALLPTLEAAWTKSYKRGRLEGFITVEHILENTVAALKARDTDALRLAAVAPPADGKGGPPTEEKELVILICSHARDKINALRKDYLTYNDAQLSELFVRMADFTDLLYRTLSLYDARLTAERRRRCICDFSDLERLAYRLLVADGKPTAVAKEISNEVDYVYIDEFQDVNALQYAILSALSREDNLFMVGDVKQSIYSFRRADPSIFAHLRATLTPFTEATAGEGSSLFFSDNFRCDEPIVRYVNEVAGHLLSTAGGLLRYTPEDDLRFSKWPPSGNMPVCTHVFEAPTKTERAELSLEAEENAAAEARFVATEIARLLREGLKADGTPICPKDITLLFRSRTHIDVYAEEVAKVVRIRQDGDSEFFLNPEVLLALSLLYTVDNPRRDVYLAATLRSPVFGFTMEELARVQTEHHRETLYDALRDYCGAHPDFAKGKRFLDLLAAWRRMAEGETVGNLLLAIYREAGLTSLSGAGTSRYHDNLYRLYQYARSFEGSSYAGLYNFISYVNAAIEAKEDVVTPATEGDEDAVRFMTMHSAKGLEFPVCFVCNLNARFNHQDTREPILYDRDHGVAVCLPDEQGVLVRNPLRAALAERMRRTQAEEEIRLLYVALTRARERLYVLGTFTSLDKKTTPRAILEATELDLDWRVTEVSSMLGWILPMRLAANDPHLVLHPLPALPQRDYPIEELAVGRDATLLEAVRDDLLTEAYRLYERDPETVTGEEREAFYLRLLAAYEAAVAGEEISKEDKAPKPRSEAVTALADGLRARLHFTYPHAADSLLPEKLSVSQLYPAVLDGSDEPSPEGHTPADTAVLPPHRKRVPGFAGGKPEDEAARAGTATHTFMQFCDPARLRSDGAAQELDRLIREAYVSPEDGARVRLDEIEKFITSPLFARLAGAGSTRRELRFHACLPADAFTEDRERRALLHGRTVLVQGVIDCIIEEEDGYVLVDYKTDRLTAAELADPALAQRKLCERHRLQLSYYAAACERMYGKPPKEILIYSLPLGDAVRVSVDPLGGDM